MLLYAYIVYTVLLMKQKRSPEYILTFMDGTYTSVYVYIIIK